MSLSDMARSIERRRPGTLPKSITIENEYLWTTCSYDSASSAILFDDLAHAILRDAMVMAGLANRNLEGWEFFDDDGDMHETLDRDHDNCPTRSLFAAFCEVFKEKNDD